MGLAIFGQPKPTIPPISGSSMPREATRSDTKLSSRLAKSNVKTARNRSDSGKRITGRITP